MKASIARKLKPAWAGALRRMHQTARFRLMLILSFALLGGGGAATLDAIRGLPRPALHDEFSYLLAADTFASGRIKNPTHELWRHFETFHVIHTPAYVAKYPPGPGLLLALGQILTGQPIVGVWLSAGLWSGAVLWMLLGWLPQRWAIVTAAIATVQISWLSYWAHSYWGLGALSACGGALAFGALRRLSDRPRPTHGVVLGVGLGILALSRPFEGLIAGLCILLALLVRIWRGNGDDRRLQARALTPAVGLVIVALSAHGFYNRAITGAPWLMPYQLHEAQYASVPSWLSRSAAGGKEYAHSELHRFWAGWGTARHEALREPGNFAINSLIKIKVIVLTLLGPAALACLGLRFRAWDGWLGYASGTAGIVTGAALLTHSTFPHYVAPVSGLLFVLVGMGLAGLQQRSCAPGVWNWTPVVIGICVAYFAHELHSDLRTEQPLFTHQRAAIFAYLKGLPQRDLVIVSYAPDHSAHEEWVYNRADIDQAAVVWARSMSDSADRKLIEYFSDRQVWRLHVGRDVRLTAIDPPAS